MDVLTHVVVGASVAQLPFGKAKSNMGFKHRALVGCAAALFPDIDYLLFPLSPLEFLAYWHRAATHSIILAPLWALLLTFGWQLLKSMKEHRLLIYWISLITLLSHIALDSLTMYGIQWLSPLSSSKISLNLLFVVDGYFTVCVLIVLIVLFFKQAAKLRWLAVLIPVAYLGLVYQIKHHAYQQVASTNQQIDVYSSVTLLPQPFSPYYWQVIRPNHKSIDQAYIRLANDRVASIISTFLGKPSQQDYYQLPDKMIWHHFPLFPDRSPWHQLAKQVWANQSFSAFKEFAVYPVFYQLENQGQHSCIWFSDLRYHWPNAIPSFRYGMCKNDIQDWKLYRKRYFSDQAVEI